MTPFRRILVPHDFSVHADRALRVAAALVVPRGELAVLHVITPYVPVTDLPVAELGVYISTAELVSGARRRLERAVAGALGSRRAPRVTIAVEVGDPAQCIARRSRGMDLIVLATAGRTGLAHLVIGSVAEKIIRHSPVPVLSLRPEVAARLARTTRRRGRPVPSRPHRDGQVIDRPRRSSS